MFIHIFQLEMRWVSHAHRPSCSETGQNNNVRQHVRLHRNFYFTSPSLSLWRSDMRRKKLDSQQFFFRKREAKKKLNKWNVINNSSSHGWMGARRHQAGLKWMKKMRQTKTFEKIWRHDSMACMQTYQKGRRKNCCSACSRLCIMDDSIGLEYRWEQTHTVARWLWHISALFFRTAYFGLHQAPHTELQNICCTLFFLSDKLISIFISLPQQHGIDERTYAGVWRNSNTLA